MSVDPRAEARSRASRIIAMRDAQERDLDAFGRAFGIRRSTETLGRALGYVGCLVLGVGRLPGPLVITRDR